MDNIRKPDVKNVAVTRKDGGITLLKVIETEYMPNPKNPSERIVYKHYDVTNEYVNSLIAKYVNDGHWVGDLEPVSWRFVSEDFVTKDTDRTFRGAWKDIGKDKPDHDMPRAREIHKKNLRFLRQPLLKQLDANYIMADEKQDSKLKKEIADRKQTLRDITDHPSIEKALTVEELKVAAINILNQ